MTILRCRVERRCPWKIHDEVLGSEIQRDDHEEEHIEFLGMDQIARTMAWQLEIERYRLPALHSSQVARILRIARRNAGLARDGSRTRTAGAGR